MVTIDALVARAAAWFGNRPAVVDGERTATFADVERRSNRLANLLVGLGGATGGRVAMLLPNRLESVEIDFGIAKAGRVRVPLNTRLALDERAFILADSGADTLVFDAAEEESVAELRALCPQLRHLIRLGAGRLGLDYDEALAAAVDRPAGVALAPDAPSFLLYTSGTTGRPKGATATNRSRLAATVNMLADEIDPRPGDGMLHVGSMAHGSGSKVLAHFLRGSRNLPVRSWDPERFLALVARERATHSFLVPTMVAALTDVARRGGQGPESLRAITYGGSPIAPATLGEAIEVFGPRFVQVYGSCEAPHPVLVLPPRDHVPNGARLGTAGREVTTIQVRLVGPDGVDVPDGQAGELWVRGPNVMAGYWGRSEADREVFRDGWYRTGDVARRDGDGYLSIVDRMRELIISGGYNVYPAEVEAALARHPGVAEVAVIGVPDDRWGEAVKAIVVRRPGATPSERELVEHCATTLAGYKKPRLIEFVDALPRGSTGKIAKRVLREPYWQGRERHV
ncbi:long-chain fatty acid--CoA ligase [Dactylosporangium fulvum]|uniref:AMP-binding protein n=1 Tax=Dactylosporangium fulvum TaxID=53359 RepID=A0ABY5W6J5_9ACTN|nr:AMP-binding protein [Dactylosporangium fulvum]UWP85615.1 AMP-binding protein [Dactylosporangium fulvum]